MKTPLAAAMPKRRSPRRWTGRWLEYDVLTGLFREGLVGGLAYFSSDQDDGRRAYDTLDVQPRSVSIRGAKIPKFSWAWTASTCVAGACAGVGGLTLDGLVRVLARADLSLDQQVLGQMRTVDRIVRRGTDHCTVHESVAQIQNLLQGVEEYTRRPSLSMLDDLLRRASETSMPLLSEGVAAYPTYLTIVGVRLLLLQERAGYVRQCGEGAFLAQVDESSNHHAAMVRRVQADTDPCQMTKRATVVRTLLTTGNVDPAGAHSSAVQGFVLYYHHKQAAAGTEVTGYTLLRDGHWVRPASVRSEILRDYPADAFIQWEERRLDLITSILGPATEIVKLMQRATPIPTVTLLATRTRDPQPHA